MKIQFSKTKYARGMGSFGMAWMKGGDYSGLPAKDTYCVVLMLFKWNFSVWITHTLKIPQPPA